jgi:hypothetical protein
MERAGGDSRGISGGSRDARSNYKLVEQVYVMVK